MASYIVETPWETRNLGIPSYSIEQEFYTSPDFDALKRTIERLHRAHTSFFISTRIEKSSLVYAAELERLGFYLIECVVTPFMRLQRNEILTKFHKHPMEVVPRKYRVKDLEFVIVDRQKHFPADRLRTIARESFSDDRFHLDYQCPKSIADRRFSYWVDDLLSDQHVMIGVLTLEGDSIGFMAFKENCLILAGFAKRYIKSGLGDFLWLSTCQVLQERGYHLVETHISINNLPVLNLYARLGFKFKETQYSFHFWSQK